MDHSNSLTKKTDGDEYEANGVEREKANEVETVEKIFESKEVPPWQKQLTFRAFFVSLISGILFTFIVMKLNLTTGIIPSLNVSAGLLGFFFIKLWTTALDKSGLLKQPFTRQENTVIQTCVVATSGIAFSGSNRPNKRTNIVIVPEELQLQIEKVICSDRESATAIAAIAAATDESSGGGKDENMTKTDMAVASAATLVATQCVEAAEAMGAERDHLASVVSSAVNVRSAGDIMTLTAAAATALRGATTLKTRTLKDVWNIAAVIPVDKGMGVTSGGGNDGSNGSSDNFSDELIPEENFLEIYSRELLARGCELLKRTRNGYIEDEE